MSVLLHVMQDLHITCPKCEGKGEIDLPEHLRETLRRIPAGKTKTAYNIAAELDIASNAASNRLVDLFLLKLLKRKREGKFWRYSRA